MEGLWCEHLLATAMMSAMISVRLTTSSGLVFTKEMAPLHMFCNKLLWNFLLRMRRSSKSVIMTSYLANKRARPRNKRKKLSWPAGST